MKPGLLLLLMLAWSEFDGLAAITQIELQSPRSAHTSTLLANGTVLITGGMHILQQATVTTELYHPQSNIFTKGPQLPIALQSHSATKLADGSVILVGGYDGSSVRGEIYRYRPTSNQLQKVGTLANPRMSHTATLLKDGNLLLVGGYGLDMQVLDSAEIFDTHTNIGKPVAARMSVPRLSHVSVLLSDGRVAVIGGHQGRGSQTKVHRRVEYFNPNTNAFEYGGQMQFPRHKHDALLLADGTILIIAGSSKQDWNGRYRHAEVYDTKSDKSTTLIPLKLPRFKIRDTSILLANNKVLLTGGAKQAEIIDIKTSASTLLAINFGQEYAFARSVKLANGKILVSGGYDTKMNITKAAWTIDLSALSRELP